MRLFVILILSLNSIDALSQQGILTGLVTDARTAEPLPGVTVFILNTDLGGVTDQDGYYQIQGITPNTYNVRASYVGFEAQIQYNIVLRSEGNPELNFQLVENARQLDGVTIVSNPFGKSEESPLSIQRLSQEEVASYPGGNNDITKVVQSLPGISGSTAGFRNDIIIRGGAPSENVYYLDGVEIPNINHFSTQGSAGGPVGLLNVSFIENVTLTTSSFAAQYDNVLSGVLQFDQRRGNDREFAGNLRIGASESALTFEGPLFRGEKERSNTTFIASVRRSYLQFLFDLIGLPILPDYWDYQYKLTHKLDEYNELSITGIGSVDDFSVNELEEFDPAQQAVQDQVPIIRQRTNTVGLSWKKRFRDGSGFMQNTISTNVLNNNFLRYKDNINQTDLYFRNDSRERESKYRFSLTKFLNNWTTVTGITFQDARYENRTSDLVNSYQYNSNLQFFRYGIFLQGSSNLLNDRLTFAAGLRADGNSFTESGNNLFNTLSPRVALSYQLSNSRKVSWTASAGRYFKLPPYTVLGFKNAQNQFINKSTTYIKSDHFVTGIEWLTTASSRLTVETFVKKYADYPVSTIEGVSLANKGGGFEVLGNEPVESIGQGRTYGVEFLYQQKFNGRYFAIAAVTFYKSEFSGINQEYRPSSWDNGQIISLTAGYKFKRNWDISTKFRFLGKAPYAPVDEAASLSNYPAIIKDYNLLGTVRLNPLSQLDLRINKKWSLRKFSIDVFVDLQNVLVSDTPSEPSYGLSRDNSGNVIEPMSLTIVDDNQDGALIPTIGLVVNF